jgi:hypothetical protein
MKTSLTLANNQALLIFCYSNIHSKTADHLFCNQSAHFMGFWDEVSRKVISKLCAFSYSREILSHSRELDALSIFLPSICHPLELEHFCLKQFVCWDLKIFLT